MADRGRGGRGRGSGDRRGGRPYRGGARGGAGSTSGGRGGLSNATHVTAPSGHQQRQAVDLGKYKDQQIKVKFNGGREVVGVLKGWDALLNVILDEAEEILRELGSETRQSGKVRKIGLLMCRGTNIAVICPMQGAEEIENPFLTQDDE